MKISLYERQILFAQLGMILQAGYGMEQGLTLIEEQTDRSTMKEVVHHLKEQRQLQPSLSEAFKACAVFDAYAVYMIAAGEMSGNLDEVMLSLATYYERMNKMTDELKQALSYPIILMIMMLMVVGVVAWKVLPIFQNVLQSLGSDLSSQAIFFMKFGRYFSWLAFFILALGVLFLLSFLMYAKYRNEDASSLFLAHCPFLGKLRSSAMMAQLTYVLAMLMSSGMDLREALPFTKQFIQDDKLLQKLEQCSLAMEQGTAFPDAVRTYQLYEGLNLNMIEIGFASGKGDEVMQQLSGQLQNEVERQIQRFLMIIEPAVVFVLAVIIGIVLLSIMLPLMSILSSL